MTPSDWMPRGIAMDCLWYDEFQGNEACAKYGCSLGIDEDSPCFLCKDYKLFEKGSIHDKEKTRILLDTSSLPSDRNGQFYFRL
jgi:hypothetical protein